MFVNEIGAKVVCAGGRMAVSIAKKVVLGMATAAGSTIWYRVVLPKMQEKKPDANIPKKHKMGFNTN